MITKPPIPWVRSSSLVKRQRRAGTCVPFLVMALLLLAAHLLHSPLATNLPPWPRLIPHSWPALGASWLLWSDICVPSNAYAEIPIPNVMVWGGGAFGGRCLVHEGGVSALVKETPQSSPDPSAMWGHNEKSEARKRVLSRTWLCWLFDLGLPDSTTVRDTFLSLISSQSVAFCSSSLHRLGHRPGLLLSAVAPLSCNRAVSRVSLFQSKVKLGCSGSSSGLDRMKW